MDKHIGGKRLFHEAKHVKDNHSQDLINALIILMNEIRHTFYETSDWRELANKCETDYLSIKHIVQVHAQHGSTRYAESFMAKQYVFGPLKHFK